MEDLIEQIDFNHSGHKLAEVVKCDEDTTKQSFMYYRDYIGVRARGLIEDQVC